MNESSLLLEEVEQRRCTQKEITHLGFRSFKLVGCVLDIYNFHKKLVVLMKYV